MPEHCAIGHVRQTVTSLAVQALASRQPRPFVRTMNVHHTDEHNHRGLCNNKTFYFFIKNAEYEKIKEFIKIK
jgi:hypothetical protein